MDIKELENAFAANGKRFVTIGNENAAAVIALDIEGRVFTAFNGRIISRVNREVLTRFSSREGYVNPGGDGLWAAPEGTCYGYHYCTGSWRVPTGVTSARFQVTEQSADSVTVEAEIDLVNSRQLALPCIFRRTISVSGGKDNTVVDMRDSIIYIGAKELTEADFRLAPWSLCQFDVTRGTYARFQASAAARDLYGESTQFRRAAADGTIEAAHTDTQRWQLSLGETAEFIELVLPEQGLRITRSAASLQPGEEYIDIADADPETVPSSEVCRLSVYNDPSGFMEIESAGPCIFPLKHGTELVMNSRTEYRPL